MSRSTTNRRPTRSSTGSSTGSSTSVDAKHAVHAEYRINVPDGYDVGAQAVPLDASVHLRSEHPMVVTVYGDEQRAVLKFGTPTGSGLHLYLPAEMVERLIAVLTVAAFDLAGLPVPISPVPISPPEPVF